VYKNKDHNAVRAAVAILVISASLLLAVAGVNTFVGNTAQAHVGRDANATDFGDARLSDGMTPAK